MVGRSSHYPFKEKKVKRRGFYSLILVSFPSLNKLISDSCSAVPSGVTVVFVLNTYNALLLVLNNVLVISNELLELFTKSRGYNINSFLYSFI